MSAPFPIGSPFAQPVRLTQAFGGNPQYYRRFSYHNIPLKGHNGMDFGVPIGTPVLAVDDGVIVEQGFEDGGFGCYVKMRHTWGESVYAHLTSSPGRPVDFVERGQLIGVSGNTGGSTGPHLHLGIRVDPYRRGDGWGGFCDPLPMLPDGAIDEGLTRGMMEGLAEPGKPSGMINNSEV